MKIGILGGTFNPIHYGHLRPAEEVRVALGLEQVRFVPLAVPAHKSEDDIAPAADRLEMVRMVLDGHPHFVCDSIEIDRGGVSYSVDTLAAMLEGSCRGHDIFFIIGADAFSLLSTWREPLRLLKMTNFAVTLRGEQNAVEVMSVVESTLRDLDDGVRFNKNSDNTYQYIDSERVIRFASVNTLDISGTKIRGLVFSEKSLQNLLPPVVEAFIIRRGLYRSNGNGN
ncbi:MAG: nicotinate (nicotinamide) nucleotide adenylyltransferase [Nitrospinaceae bacterium]|nr:nicotinate (nicotinamide) nucleotide adenylyltransferase [Nitrospinaceae bacterium]MBT3435221.1 nicotinate (nicotinamide) nucleotide adenylyltransferase [Nitrospinaceae bacterium]MBT3821874.1 nicotinate (nicotinamide) nucleotide adenylyltransferase [Nitrospinaceae bacterium]MBT4094807.1 nicotinate (nicotinamide) nucleotide adenylyltransferase [Nitrospinaceae bacterium]MBT4429178.1 nicotinate (nicotinamide) nucleotide adenylyltransferase [Nitrospinaceae bacterium]